MLKQEDKGQGCRLNPLNLQDFSDCLVDNIAEPANKVKNFFTVKSANQVLKDAYLLPPQKELFGKLWFEHEICCLFADTNTGKSILAVQVAETIAGNNSLLNCDIPPAAVLYFDFELSEKQFQTRYTEGNQLYQFSDKFQRIEINPDADIPATQTFEDCLTEQIEELVISSGAKILIIDNLTYLRSDNEKAKDALPLMKKLKQLKSKYQLSILILAHTPKRDNTRPLGKNDLAGSKMLINFVDSAFCIGESQKDSKLRYIKQVKSRNAEIIYDAENIMVCKVIKQDAFLQFSLAEYGKESDHLQEKKKRDSELDNKILQLHQDEPHLSDRAIAERLETNHKKVGRVLSKN